MLRPSPPPSYHELPKRRRTCLLLGWNRWETMRSQVERLDRCMLGCMATLLFIFGFFIYIVIALSPLILFLLFLSVLPSPINSSVLLTPHSFSTGIGYLSPNETYIMASFHIPIRIQFPTPDTEEAEVKTIQVHLWSGGRLMGGGERSPSSSIEMPWMERTDDILTAAIPVETLIREKDGAPSCIRGETISMRASVSVHLVSDSWMSTKSGVMHYNQPISLCCQCIFPRKEERSSTLKPRKHSSSRPSP